LAMGRIDCKSI